MKTNTTYLPLEWQHRIRTLPTINLRARLAVYLIQAYKRRRLADPDYRNWRIDLSLGHLAFWPEAFRKSLFNYHVHFCLTDRPYRALAKPSGIPCKETSNTICAEPNSNTLTSPLIEEDFQ